MSPPKWHLAHTTWFWETMLLERLRCPATRCFTQSTPYLFNSYYNSLGSRVNRADRGTLSRPAAGRRAGATAPTWTPHMAGPAGRLSRPARRRRASWWSWACSTSSSTRSCWPPTSSSSSAPAR
ncbi:MAG: hypothetical protein WKG07_16000 [Hymenobacter sp.]